MNQELTITETRDWQKVWQISQRPEVRDCVVNDEWERMGDDVRRCHVRIIVENGDNHCLMVSGEGKEVGCFVCDSKGKGIYEVHTMLTSECRGRDAIRAGRLAIKKIFSLRGVEKLISYCPCNMPQTYFFAIWCGFHSAGKAAWSWIKNGVAFDVKIVELTKGGLPCHSL